MALESAGLEFSACITPDCAQVAASLRPASGRLATPHPDLVIVNLDLAGQCGLELLKVLAATLANLPVVVLTSLARDEIEAQLQSPRPTRYLYLRKPPTLDEFLALGQLIAAYYQSDAHRAADAGL